MKTIIYLILCVFGWSLYAQDNQAINKDVDFSFIYRQAEFNLEDEQGDVSLCKSIVQKGVKQIGDLFHFKSPLGGFIDKMYEKAVIKYPEFIIPDDVGNPYDLISFEATKSIDLERTKRILSCELKRPTKVDPIKLNSFMKMIQQVIVEEKNNIKLSAGEVHRWSKQSRRKYVFECPLILQAPKLLAMLATGVSFRFAYTGLEDVLVEEISHFPVRSLYPHDIFRMSYRLNKGNLYLTLLTIENVFSRHWTAPQRESKRVTTRLAHITNDPENDNFGTWYHLFGTMLFGYSHGSFISWSAGVVEAGGSLVASGFKGETQENKINLMGARIGGRMRRLAKNDKRLTDLTSVPSYTDPRFYLNLLEFDCNNKNN
jgi:hypothetical protein